MVRSVQVLRIAAIGSIYFSLGTGVFAGCGDPALNSKRSGSSTTDGSKSLQSQQAASLDSRATEGSGLNQPATGQQVSQGPGLRHSTNDTEHVVLRAAPSNGTTAAESVALCSDRDYSEDRANGQTGATEGDRSVDCRAP